MVVWGGLTNSCEKKRSKKQRRKGISKLGYLNLILNVCLCAKSFLSCPSLCNHMDCSPPGSSVHGVLQARILEWVAMPFFKGSFWPRDGTMFLLSPALAGRFLTISTTWEALILNITYQLPFFKKKNYCFSFHYNFFQIKMYTMCYLTCNICTYLICICTYLNM